MLKAIVHQYFINTSFHGFRFIAEKERHWTERYLWVFCCTLSWLASAFLMKSAWDDFQNNAISFVAETSYLDWNTTFPSVSVCETDNYERISKFTDKTYGDPHDYNLDEMIKEFVFFSGLNYYTLQICGPDALNPNQDCPRTNFSEFSKQIRSSCPEIFQICKWNSETFNCCRYFSAIYTELGLCYAINSLQTSSEVPKFPMISNKYTGPGKLYFELKGQANIYVLGAQDVPSLTTLATDKIQVYPYIYYQRYMAIKEIDNQPEVKDVDVRQRKCRFIDESDLDVYKYYSYSSCCVQCRKNAQLKECKCVHHLMPNTRTENHCKMDGLYCLNKNYNDLAVLKAPWTNRSGLVCNCLPSCTEIEISVIKDHKNGISDNLAMVELALVQLPTERFKRNVVRGRLDLVVSMGGSIALFLGASILSFVEIFYYLLVRPSYHST